MRGNEGTKGVERHDESGVAWWRENGVVATALFVVAAKPKFEIPAPSHTSHIHEIFLLLSADTSSLTRTCQY